MNTPQLIFLSSIFAGISIYCFSVYFEDKDTIVAKTFRTIYKIFSILITIVLSIFIILGAGSVINSARKKYWDNK